MKLLLSGYEGSKRIIQASAFLLRKYVPGGTFEEIRFLNYGAYDDRFLPRGVSYVSLKDRQRGVESWARDLADYIEEELLGDEVLAFALDDYLMAFHARVDLFTHLLGLLLNDPIAGQARLCLSDFYTEHEVVRRERWRDTSILTLSSQAAYSVTTQYALWRPKVLWDVLRHVETPWEFETLGSTYFNTTGWQVIATHPPPMVYPVNSSLSSRWVGVDVSENWPLDVTDLIALGYLKKGDIRVK